ncbi:MAG: LLM class F420-dependent oxidoreductase [Ilumatobacteraceae bacterium]|nr:LLM class F420-dependent oxidoreductase [Ilumatobacteraceae bacterium]
MDIGAVIPHNEIGNDPGAIKAFAQGAEELGITHLMIYDHVVGVDRNRPGGFVGPYDSDTAFHEPMVLFGFLAACTERVGLVTAIVILPQRQTVLAAKQAAEVAILSGNRLKFGIGVGWNTVEYDALNENFENRGKRQEEQVELMRRLWTEDAFSFEGEFHSFEHASILPRPTEPIPILFGGSAPAVLDRCARMGDGWLPLGIPNEKSVDRIAEMRRVREATGKSWDDFEIRPQAQWSGETPERWQNHAQRWKELGATHIAVATHNAGETDVDGHLARIAEYQAAVADVVG